MKLELCSATKEVRNETCNEKNPSFSPVTFFVFSFSFHPFFFPFRSTAGEKEREEEEIRFLLQQQKDEIGGKAPTPKRLKQR